MRPDEELMDSIERDITKVLIDSRNKMYQRMSQEKPPNEGSELKYMLRYYDSKKSLRTRLLKPEEGKPLVKTAKMFLLNTQGADKNTFWLYDAKQNLIYSQVQ